MAIPSSSLTSSSTRHDVIESILRVAGFPPFTARSLGALLFTLVTLVLVVQPTAIHLSVTLCTLRDTSTVVTFEADVRSTES